MDKFFNALIVGQWGGVSELDTEAGSGAESGRTEDVGNAPLGVWRPAAVVEVAEGPPQRLDNFLLGRLKGLPKSRVYRMVRRGEVRVNGARARPATRVRDGDRVRLPPHRGAAADEAEVPLGAFAGLMAGAIYEDDGLLVLDKPSGLAVHGGSGVSFGVIEILRRHRPQTGFELAHRLDRDTSGCLAVAKSRSMLRHLHAAFRQGRVGKRYDLIVAGQWPSKLRLMAEPLKRYVLANGERRVRVDAAGEPARTGFKVLRRGADSTWLAAYPKTGRTHQIRVHAAAAGHPILGDEKYGNDAAGRLLLHASELKLQLGDAAQRFEAPLPPAFGRWRDAVGVDAVDDGRQSRA